MKHIAIYPRHCSLLRNDALKQSFEHLKNHERMRVLEVNDIQCRIKRPVGSLNVIHFAQRAVSARYHARIERFIVIVKAGDA